METWYKQQFLFFFYQDQKSQLHTMYYLDKQEEEEDVKEGEDVEDDDDDCYLALDVVELAILLLDLGAHAHRHVGEVAQDAEDDGDDWGRYKD